tara:strand:- start:31 stop:384 length:354 start_codon:yes stop_codon:yes gene_type:complete
MSQRTVVTKDGTEYKFENFGWSTSRSWGHESNLYINGVWSDWKRVTYINRTWEAYQYQSCMRGLIYDLRHEAEKGYIDSRKVKEGIKRLRKALRENWELDFQAENPVYDEVLKALNL